ncbi:MAG TPA: OsmC family peroxiredoxin [Capillimicrobium sp.]|nr:OsmC family peroxiredoxin [Capillimicrobium sp.]
MAARAGAEWRGDLKGGSGDLIIGENEWSGPFTFESRFEDGGAGFNPEQLIGAALAGCFSMQVSNELAQAGTPVNSVRTDARVQLRNVDGKPTIASIALRTVGDVPGIDAETFRRYAEEAKTGCIVSRALAGVGEITLEAELAGG